MSDIIKVEKLVEVYRGGTKAVDNISFTVKSGARGGDC
jgi:ABC-type multidrug transport system ATPase subunit